MSEGFVFNGINGATGGGLLPEMSAEELATIALGEKFDEQHLLELKERWRMLNDPHFSPEAGVDPKNLAETGWGVVFAHADGVQVDAWREALKPLLDLRRQQAGPLYKEYVGPDAFRPGESKDDFLSRHGMGPGPVAPAKVPYYLLLVAGPESIPYRVQYQLDVQHAVGRIFFDSLEHYANYAASVVRSERGEFVRSPRASFFGVHNPNDNATRLSATQLVQPLAEWMAKDKPSWSVQSLIREEATKAKLASLLGDASGPALLFTASHGMGFPKDDPRQLRHQGALLCQDWPGTRGPVSEACYFSGDDIGSDARLGGMISFAFACYGAGTPQQDDFAHRTLAGAAMDIAPRPFVAHLPQCLLGHPKGGALAMVGHVERAWGCSFVWPDAGAQRTVFESALKLLAEGHPVGSALEYFNQRYAQLSSDLSDHIWDVKYGKTPDNPQLAAMWTANNDARSYVIVGDPAVRLPASATGASGTSPLIVGPEVLDVRTPHGTQPNADAGSTPFDSNAGARPNALAVTTSIASNVQQPGDKRIVAQTMIAAGAIETVVDAGLAGSSGLLALHGALVEKALDARMDQLKK